MSDGHDVDVACDADVGGDLLACWRPGTLIPFADCRWDANEAKRHREGRPCVGGRKCLNVGGDFVCLDVGDCFWESNGFYSATGDWVRELGSGDSWSALGYFLKPAFLSGTVPCNATYLPTYRVIGTASYHAVDGMSPGVKGTARKFNSRSVAHLITVSSRVISPFNRSWTEDTADSEAASNGDRPQNSAGCQMDKVFASSRKYPIGFEALSAIRIGAGVTQYQASRGLESKLKTMTIVVGLLDQEILRKMPVKERGMREGELALRLRKGKKTHFEPK
ncbi:hypothetical protein B0H19DRAFT_1084577 [Mycena capillaripes]|nr:hypothetical protein B0H19DRAFT_1084577 [Mycena capillaripes]